MTNYNQPIVPPATIGILGGGQLGQMMALSAKYMGYKVGILDPKSDAPAAQVSDFHITAEYDDQDAVNELAKRANVLTYEFENVDQNSLLKVKNQVQIPQGIDELTITSNRINEKNFLRKNNVPVTEYAKVLDGEQLKKAVKEIGRPGILKTAEGGYDGHGQMDINEDTDLAPIIDELDGNEFIYEKKQPFAKEVSMMVTRDGNGKVITFPLSENEHQHHILHTSIVPGRVSDQVHQSAAKEAEKIANGLQLSGVLGIEFFLMPDDSLMVNELAPRPHNSGHYSIEACNVSQFEAHIRSICGLPIPNIEQTKPAVMVNMLGDDLTAGYKGLSNHPEWHFHDYGKDAIHPGRKMGHITVLGKDIDQLLKSVNQFE